MSSQQITTWLQSLFLFAVVWSLGGTMTGDSRKKFDVFYRTLIMGMDVENPRPKNVKLKKNNVFPERGYIDSAIILYKIIFQMSDSLTAMYNCSLVILQAPSMITTSISMDMDSGISGLNLLQTRRMPYQLEPMSVCQCQTSYCCCTNTTLGYLIHLNSFNPS